ncbi:MAG: BcpO-related WXXGXW repeat protein [Chlorobiaceae bacterium]|nr:BcpO-related WXXGXW repeat protein [Chlorobiaceae bacterium]
MKVTLHQIDCLLDDSGKNNKETKMKSRILMIAGVAGMFMASPALDAMAEVNVRIGSTPRHAFVIDRRPDFIQLGSQGFSVSYGSPYDIVLYNNFYYLHNNGTWYRSRNYNGPWIVIRDRALPPRIRRHRIEDIRRYRDVEYRRDQGRYDRERSGRDGRWDRRDDRRQEPPRGDNDRRDDNRR